MFKKLLIGLLIAMCLSCTAPIKAPETFYPAYKMNETADYQAGWFKVNERHYRYMACDILVAELKFNLFYKRWMGTLYGSKTGFQRDIKIDSYGLPMAKMEIEKKMAGRYWM